MTDNKPFEVKFDSAALPDYKRKENLDRVYRSVGVYFNQTNDNYKQDEKVWLKWLKHDGDWVDEGQPLYRIRVRVNDFESYTSPPLAATKSGVVQHCKKEYDIIQNGETIYIVHSKGTYSKENSPSNPNFFFYFDTFKYAIPDKYKNSNSNVQIKQWHKEDGQFVNEKEIVLTLSCYEESLFHYAEKSGFLDIVERVGIYSFHPKLQQNELIYIIHDKDEDRIKRKFFASNPLLLLRNPTKIKEMTDNTFEAKFDAVALPGYKQNEMVYLGEWLRHDGDWVDEGHPLYTIRIPEGSFRFNTSPPLAANKSGILQQCKGEKDTIQHGETIYIIHPKGTYSKENTPANPDFFFYFDKFKYAIPDPYKYWNVKLTIIQCHKEDGQFVNEKELVLTLGFPSIQSIKESFFHYAEKSGYFNRVKQQPIYSHEFEVEQNELVYIIHDKDEDRIKRKFINAPEIKVDDFTQKKIIKWSKVGGANLYRVGITSHSVDGNISLTFSFNNEDGKDFICFQFLSKQILLGKDDIISFLFEDGRTIDFALNTNSYKI
jgi:hypothetical protein